MTKAEIRAELVKARNLRNEDPEAARGIIDRVRVETLKAIVEDPTDAPALARAALEAQRIKLRW